MTIVTPEVVDKIIKGGENLAKVAAGSTNELVSEAVNLFIIDSVLSILKFSVVFIIFYIVKRYVDVLMQDCKRENINLFKALKTTALVLSLIFFTSQSFPHIQQVAKALVAPKLFLAEKTLSMTKDKQ